MILLEQEKISFYFYEINLILNKQKYSERLCTHVYVHRSRVLTSTIAIHLEISPFYRGPDFSGFLKEKIPD